MANEPAQHLQPTKQLKTIEIRCKKCHKRHFDAVEKQDKSHLNTVIVWLCPKCNFKNVIVL